MWYPAEIVLKSYLPLELEEGMLFINRISVGIMEPYIELWELEEIPEDMDAFMALNGAPVNLMIVIDDYPEEIIVTEDQIGWWDEGDHTDELRDILLDDINMVLREFNGELSIDIDDEEEDNIVPTLFENKVILAFDQEENDELEDWDVTTSEGLED
jgi:hypothetical protein